ncbi:hypothetical protein B0H14DRAFT_2585818 [Mycena olivaceomarginata]|nr:hypothetical protein B0H14DRAFT_2585818 [Mycena olivaceomarginata]
MPQTTMDWIWSEYTTSPDLAAGMQSLNQTCSALTKHVLLPSHIVLSGGGFTLLPELAEILTDILTCTTGLEIATQNQIVWSWIHLVDKVYIAMVDLKRLCSGRPIHVLGRKHPSTMPQILAALPSTLRAEARLCRERPEATQAVAIAVSPPERSQLPPAASAPIAVKPSQASGRTPTPAAPAAVPVTVKDLAPTLILALSTQPTAKPLEPPSPPASCGNTRAEHSRRQGERGVSAQVSAPAVIRQGPMPETASPMAPMDIADADICTSHAVEVELDGPRTRRRTRPRSRRLRPRLRRRRSPQSPAANSGVNLQAQIACGHEPAAAVFAAIKDAPHASPPTSTLPSTRGPSVDAGESTELVGLDKVHKEQADNTALPRRYELPMRNSFWTAPTPDLADVKYAPKAAMPAAVKDPPCDSLCAIMFASVRESDHPAENEGRRDRGMEENLRDRESSVRDCALEFQRQKPPTRAFTTSTTPGTRVRASPSASTTEAMQSHASDKKEQSKRTSIGSSERKVLLPPPAPVLTYGERAVKPGGRMVDQQDFISNVAPRTLDELKDMSVGEPSRFSSVASCVLPCHLSVPSSVMACLDSVLVSTPSWAIKHAYIEHLEVGHAAPYRLWEREGIGTRLGN